MGQEIMGCVEKDASVQVQIKLIDRMLENKKRLEEKLSNLNEAIDFLQKNPGFAEFTDILRKVDF